MTVTVIAKNFGSPAPNSINSITKYYDITEVHELTGLDNLPHWILYRGTTQVVNVGLTENYVYAEVI